MRWFTVGDLDIVLDPPRRISGAKKYQKSALHLI
jgi:hypothetical protein